MFPVNRAFALGKLLHDRQQRVRFHLHKVIVGTFGAASGYRAGWDYDMRPEYGVSTVGIVQTAIQKLQCLTGSHVRSRKSARLRKLGDREIYVSRCAGCNTMMIKDGHGWRLPNGDEQGSLAGGSRG